MKVSILPNSEIENVITYDTVHQLLRHFPKHEINIPQQILQLLLVQNELKDKLESSPVLLRLAVNLVLNQGLKKLASINSRAERILVGRFMEDKFAKEVAAELGISRDRIQREQREAIKDLVDILRKNEHEARKQHVDLMVQPLGIPSYTRLFGMDRVCHQLVEQLLTEGHPWNITITGIGGIGKSSIADQVIRQAVNNLHYQRVIKLYIRSGSLTESQLIEYLAETLLLNSTGIPQNEQIAQIRHLLKTVSHLIFIDNLESDISHLFDFLETLSRPSRFLLTVREQPVKKNRVYVLPIKPLSLENSADLIRHLAQNGQAYQELASIADEQIKRIYEKVGGNPLALKLVVGLVNTFSIPDILEDLKSIQHDDTKKMYLHIFWNSWQALDDISQRVLQVFPLISGKGEVSEVIYKIVKGKYSELTNEDVTNALSNLVTRSLVEVSGSVWSNSYLYSIHNLTRSFLTTNIIDWPSDSI
ncbi:MAG: hypothetical protein H6657_14790 [Ardenticatenaceae bacterium]|nr:hypothetical protein [Ardenticatenaceae bacterium]